MNKRQVLDIVLIIFGLYFLIYFVQSMISTTWYFFFSPKDEFMRKGVYILMMWVYLLIPLVVSALLLFKREKLINMLIGKSEQQEPKQSDSLPCYTRLAFWIQILGLYYLIPSGAQLIREFVIVFSVRTQYATKFTWWHQMGQSIVIIIVALVLIRQSEPIANFINKITKQV
ncbi:MAG: hypothetical protein PHW62_02355 [Candidatus Ratteibacteria bacterium]|nr:hypothetical protein [Candidatus Ratteibacteria bacterium]